MPAFTKVRYHSVPDQSHPRGMKRLWVKCGAQVIDRAWCELRRAVGKGKVKEVNSVFSATRWAGKNGVQSLGLDGGLKGRMTGGWGYLFGRPGLGVRNSTISISDGVGAIEFVSGFRKL